MRTALHPFALSLSKGRSLLQEGQGFDKLSLISKGDTAE